MSRSRLLGMVSRLRSALCFVAVLSFFFGGADGCLGQAAPPVPSGDELLRGVRETYTRVQKNFNGRLRQGFEKTPFVMALSPDFLRFRFSEPTQIIHLSVSGERAFLKEVVEGTDAPVAASRYSEVIRGTDVTYEDLAMRFLYWKNAEVIVDERNSDKVSGHECHRVRVRNNPDGIGNYATVDVLVDKESGAMVQMIGYNADGESIKRFTVISVKKFDDIWIPDELRIDTLDPSDSGTSLSKTYLEILDVVE